jgi:hypothetical protein
LLDAGHNDVPHPRVGGIYNNMSVLGYNILFLTVLLSLTVQRDEYECDNQTDWEKNDNPVLTC